MEKPKMVVFVVKRYAVREAEKWRYAVRKAKIGRYAVRKGGGGVTLLYHECCVSWLKNAPFKSQFWCLRRPTL